MTAFKPFVATVTILLAGAAFAQTPATPPAATPPPAMKPHGLKGMDTNKDGKLSREEVKARPMLAKKFDEIDTNKDGQLSREELKTFRDAHKGQAKK